MNLLYKTLTAIFVVTLSFTSKANDTLLKLAQPLATAHSWSYKGGGTNLDAVTAWKTDLAYAEPAWLTNRPAPFRFGTTSPASNTTIPGDASSGGAGNTGARYPTLYFRKVVNVTNPSSYVNFKINAKFDDAIVVWVNGSEAFRNNIAANPAYATLSTTSMAGDGATIFTGNIPTSLFNTGNNLIAVEIHQTTATSGDLFFDMELIGMFASTPVITRGPYLNLGGKTGITLRWRTDVPTTSRVTYGTTLGTYTNTVDSTVLKTEHQVQLSGLTPDTKYYYTIGNNTTVFQSGAANHFLTLPPDNTNRKIRMAVFGDCGFLSTNQTFTQQAYMNFLNARGVTDIDGLVMLGDNIYETGTDVEWQTNFFDPYKDVFLKKWKLYPAPGNHDYGSTNTIPETTNRNNNYYLNFNLPTNAELGGVASGTEAFYSYDIGDIHFMALDSYGRETVGATNYKMYDTLGPQALWVKADLAANTKKWVIAYWHHAPYTKIGLNSDPAGELRDVRENFIRILERNGVDLVLCGHSHGYERSYLLKNYYKATPAGAALLDADFRKNLHTADSSSALYNGTAGSCAYTYNSGKYNHGTVYAVSGSAGKNDQGAQTGYPHDAMYFSQLNRGGAVYFEVDSNRLDLKYIYQTGNSTPVVGDSFTIFKDVKKFNTYTVSQNSVLNIQPSWKGSYNWFAGGTIAPNLSTSRTFTVPTNTVGTFRYVAKDFSTNTCLKDSFEVVVTSVIPVTLNSFTANLVLDKVLLNWSTSTELNNRYFTVEKSTNGVNYNFLTQVNSLGNSTTNQNYSSVDNAPFNGVNYYRLSQTNLDGKKTYHQTRTVLYNGKKNLQITTANIYNGIKISINSSNNAVTLSIMDALGRQVLQNNLILNANSITKEYQLTKGIYYVQVVDSKNEKISKKIIVL